MAYEVWFLIGRVIIAIYFIMSGANHFMKREMMAGYAKSKGVPMAGTAVIVSGLLLVLAGLSFGLGLYPAWGSLFVVLFMVPVGIKMHPFWSAEGDQKMPEMINFMRNMALSGAALMFLNIPTPWALSLAFG